MASIEFPFVCVKSSPLSDFVVLENSIIGSIYISKSNCDDVFIKGAVYYVSFEDSSGSLSNSLHVSSSDFTGGDDSHAERSEI